MARYQYYDCDQCEGTFRYFHHPSDSPPPETCPLCGAPNDGNPVFVPQSPMPKGVRLAAAEQVYRSMEKGSEERMQMAAEVGGGDASDYSALKITDLNTQQREGDLSYKMPNAQNNQVVNFMQTHQGAGMGSAHVAAAQEYARQAHTGYFPHAGTRTASVIGNIHDQMRGRMQGLGQLNGKAK